MTSAVITAGTSTTTGPQPAAPAAPESARQGRTSERVDFRSASARLRENAGINDTAAVAAVVSFAEVGAAARRLRASNTFSESPTLTQSGTQSSREPAPTDARADHPSFAPAVIAPVLVPVVEAPPVPSPALDERAADLATDLDAEEPIVIDLPACEVIYLDPQIGRRKVAANADRDLRRASLARRASELLATIEDAKRTLVLA